MKPVVVGEQPTDVISRNGFLLREIGLDGSGWSQPAAGSLLTARRDCHCHRLNIEYSSMMDRVDESEGQRLFGLDASQYDRVRPDYPRSFFSLLQPSRLFTLVQPPWR